MVAKRTIDGVVEATTETGGNVVETARAVAGGAAEAIGGIGTTAVTSVRDILLSVVGGVKDVASAALPRSAYAEERLTTAAASVPVEPTPEV
jgi:phage-related protein